MSSKDLWDLAVEKRSTDVSKKSTSTEGHLLFVGSKGCGKTTSIYKFLEKDEPIKPTVALEYVYGRRTKSVGGSSKNLVHVWELGGGIWLSKLVDTAINLDTIENLTVFLFLDLTAPKQLILTFETLFSAIKTRIDVILNELKRLKPEVYDRIIDAADKRIDPQNPDRQLMEVFPVPLVIVGTKYDVFSEYEPQERNLTCRTLRFLSHYYGATLIFTSIKQEAMTKRFHTLLTHYSFSVNATLRSWLANLPAIGDTNKPIFIAAGADSFADIGKPIGSPEKRLSAKTPIDLWKYSFTAVFSQENPLVTKVNVDPAKDPQYAEPAIDALRTQKDEELERYRRLSERRLKEIKQQALNEGLILI